MNYLKGEHQQYVNPKRPFTEDAFPAGALKDSVLSWKGYEEEMKVEGRMQGGKTHGRVSVGWRFPGGGRPDVVALISFPASFHLTTLTSL